MHSLRETRLEEQDLVSQFDTPVNRRGSGCMKWDDEPQVEYPLWVADMDFEAAPAIVEAVVKRAQQGIYGYTLVEDDYYRCVPTLDFLCFPHVRGCLPLL